MSKHYPTIKNAICLLLLLIAIEALMTVAAMILAHIMGWSKIDHFQSFLTRPLIFGSMKLVSSVLVIVFGFKKSETPFRQVFPLRPAPAATCAAIGVGIIGLVILLSELNNLLMTLLHSQPNPNNFLIQLFRNKNVLGTFFVLSVITPFTEEFLFRGLIFTGFLNKYSLKKAIVWSAVFFGLIHLYIYQIPGAFIYGIVFAWLTAKTGSLWPAIFAHGVANSIPLISERILKLKIEGFTCLFDGKIHFQPLWFDAIGLVLVGFSIWLLWPKLREKLEPAPELIRLQIDKTTAMETETAIESPVEIIPVQSSALGWAALISGLASILIWIAGMGLILYAIIVYPKEKGDLPTSVALAIGSVFIFGFLFNCIGTAISIAALIKKSKPAAAWVGIAMNGMCILFGIFLAVMIFISAHI
jgi:uncharacterized protein